MKKNLIWKILLSLGICPYAIPLITGIYNMNIQLWNLTDWLILYSYLYWPTYIIGVVLIAISARKLIR